MKKPIHLYILATLSGLASLMGIWGAFFGKFDEEAIRASYASFQAKGVDVDQLVNAAKASVEFSTNGINKTLIIIQLVLIIATIVFLFQKKNETASYTYYWAPVCKFNHLYLWLYWCERAERPIHRRTIP